MGPVVLSFGFFALLPLFSQGARQIQQETELNRAEVDPPESLELDGGPIEDDPWGPDAQNMSMVAEQLVNAEREKNCPEAPTVTVSLTGEPCKAGVNSGTWIACILNLTAADMQANHLVTVEFPASGGAIGYFQFEEGYADFCDGLFASSRTIGDDSMADSDSLLQRSAVHGGGWLGHAAEHEYMRQRLKAKHGVEHCPRGCQPGQTCHPACGVDVMDEPTPSARRDANLVTTPPTHYSILTDMPTVNGRDSGSCFPDQGATMVLNQGECGSCWAMASSGALSDRMCLAGVPYMDGHGLNRTLSVQQVLSCGKFPPGVDPCVGGVAGLYFDFATDKGVAKRSESVYTNKCPKSDNPHSVVAPAQLGIDCKKFSKQMEAEAPGMSEMPCVCYDQKTRPSKHPACYKAEAEVTHVFKASGFKRMPYPLEQFGGKVWQIPDIVQLMQLELLINGPYFVGFQTKSDFQDHFKTREVYIMDPKAEQRGGHAVNLVGWGVTNQLPYDWQCRGRGGQVTIQTGRPRPSRPNIHQPRPQGPGHLPYQPGPMPFRPGPYQPVYHPNPYQPMPHGPQPVYYPIYRGAQALFPSPNYTHQIIIRHPMVPGHMPMRPGHMPMGPGHMPMGPGPMGPGPMGPGPMRPGQMRPGQMGPGQMGPGGMGPRPPPGGPDTPSDVPAELNYVTDCNAALTVDYWQLRNSWGTGWGDGGYFKIRRGTNEIGIEASARVPIVDVKEAGPFRK
jgi:hypothetical protein